MADMFRPQTAPSTLGLMFSQCELIYHSAVRNVRKTHNNAIIGILLNIMQTIMLVAVFYVMMFVLGLGSTAIRGDFVLYLMSGIFMFITYNRTMSAVVGADGPTSQMMKHAPMNTLVSVASSALSSLYLQALSMVVVLFVYDIAFHPITIYQPVQVAGMLILTWFTGIAVGLVFRAAKPWNPEVVGIIMLVYQRANMIASGKMFVVNQLPSKMRHYFDWNPLFHIIDQTRGFMFINYNPHFTSLTYPATICVVCFMIGLMGEFFTRKHASLSWDAKR